MLIKAVLLICAQAFIKIISAQCIGAPYEALLWEAGSPWGASWATPFAGPLAAAPALEYSGYAPCTLAASNGGGFPVNSASPMVPTGVYVTSENVYDGDVLVIGTLPFLSSIAFEGALPSVGTGVVAYGCGNGNIAILSEDIAPATFDPVARPYGYGPAGPGIGYGLDGLYGGALGFGAGGCGCGAIF